MVYTTQISNEPKDNIMSKYITSLVDELGALKAQAASLAQREKAIKEILVAQGQPEYEGDLFRATVSYSERETLDMAAVRAKLSQQFITAHTKVTEVVSLKVVARSVDAIKKAA